MCFYIWQIFKVSNAKFSAGIFDDPLIRLLMKNPYFTKVMWVKKSAWPSFKALCHYFLPRSSEYETSCKRSNRKLPQRRCSNGSKTSFLTTSSVFLLKII